MHFQALPELGGAVPFFGHLLELKRSRQGFFRRVAEGAQPLYHLRAPVTDFALVNDPALLQEMLVDKSRDFVKSGMLRWALYPLAGDGLFTSDGELWRRQRKLMAPLFHRAQLDRYAADMVACATRTMASWHDGAVIELAPAMVQLTMAVAGKTLFDADTFGEADELGAALTLALEWSADMAGSLFAIAHVTLRRQLLQLAPHAPAAWATRFDDVARRLEGPLFLPGRRGRALRAAITLLDERVARMISERRARARVPAGSADAHADLLSKLLAAHDETGGMSDKQIRDEVLTLFVAGHETTAAALAWTFQLLAEHPEWARKVQAEVDALGDGPPSAAEVARLPLCLRVFKEALRLYPPVYAFGRQTLVPVELGGVTIPAHTIVMMAPLSLHYRADLWPEPERFDPDRFLPEAEAARHRYAWLPFGGGARVCIGNHFAMMEAPLVMAAILRRFRLESLGHEAPYCSASLRPGGPMRMRVHARR